MNSVCIATYNGEKYIKEQLDSILSQIAPDDEVIISDDGSTDTTCEIITTIKDQRITLLHHQQQQRTRYPYVANFTNALQHAKGDIIFLSDQDDVWLPYKYKTCIEALREVDLVCTNSKVTDSQLNVICDDFFTYNHSRKGVLYNIINGTYFGSCLAFRRRVLLYALPLPFGYDYDWWLGTVAEMIGATVLIGTPCLLYRRHEAVASGAFNTHKSSLLARSKRPLYIKLWNRVLRLKAVTSFYIRYKLGLIRPVR